MTYKISIIIPTYNAGNFLMNALNSIFDQTIGFNNIEVIIPDDCSNDNTRTLLKDLDEKYENIKPILFKENSGSPSKGRNVGINEANGKYIMFLDQDDSYKEDICEKLYGTAEEYNADIVNCRLYLSKNGENIEEGNVLDNKEEVMVLNSIDENPSLLVTTAIWNKIYNRSFVLENNIQFAVNELYEDTYFNIQAFTKASKIVSLNKYFGIYYNIRESGEDKATSKTFNKANLIKMYKGFKSILKYLEKNNKSYPEFEFQTLMGFTKWILLSDCEKEKKLELYREFKTYYKKFSLFLKLENVSLVKNILMNCFMKLLGFNELTFNLIISIFDNECFKSKLQNFHYLR